MKKFTKWLSFLLAIAFGLCVTGCDSGDQIDKTKTQLYVNIYYAGLGDEWINNYARAFEEFYKDYEFEPGTGKKGAEVIIDHSYASGMDTVTGLANSRAEVIWAENTPYHQLILNDLALNISDITSTPLMEFGETKSIEQKIDPSMLSYYKAYDNNVYAIPHFDYIRCVIYDVDVFEGKLTNGNGFYIAQDGGFTTGLEGQPKKSNGPDNQPNTYDDGLPATYEEFFDMLNQMVKMGITPFTWPGQYADADAITKNLWANFEGGEMSYNYTFRGLATDLVDIGADGQVIRREPLELTDANAYQVFHQEGRYRALQFTQKLVSESRYYSDFAFSPSHSHVQATEEFLYNVTPRDQRFAMLVSGVWWEEEADDIFTSLEQINEAYGKENRRFAIMPMPHYNNEYSNDNYYSGEKSKIGNQQTLVLDTQTVVYINKNIAPEKEDIAKKFLRFTSSDESIIGHLESISVPRSLNLSGDQPLEEVAINMTNYARSVLEFRENANIVAPYSENRFQWSVNTDMGFGNFRSFYSPVFTLKEHPEITPKEYFEGVAEYNAGMWQNWLESYLK